MKPHRSRPHTENILACGNDKKGSHLVLLARPHLVWTATTLLSALKALLDASTTRLRRTRHIAIAFVLWIYQRLRLVLFCSFLEESKLQPSLKTGSYVRYQQLLASGMWSKLPIWKPRVRRAVVSSGCGFGLVARKEESNGERVLIYSWSDPLHVLDLLFICFSFCCLSPMYLLRICGYWCLYQSLLFVWFVAALP